ncbi:MAG: HAMP domain-containing histidine kinase [Flavonifractor sp.]|nr:HAMP domain-containing histidine kinase [Flavonifractor sp.]
MTYLLYQYSGQMALRSYDAWGNETNRSQLLLGSFFYPKENDSIYMLFDEVLTVEEELELVHRIIELKKQIEGDNWWIGAFLLSAPFKDDSAYFEIAGVKDFDQIVPLRIVYHQGEESITVLDLGPERYQNRPVTVLETGSISFYGGLMSGPESPEERLRIFRRLEANLDTLEEWIASDSDRVLHPNSYRNDSMLPDGMTYRREGHFGNYHEGDLAYSYWVDPLYIFYGLEWVLALTFLLVLALAVFTAHVQARSVRRERAFTRAAAHELKTPLAVLRTHAEALKEDISPEKRGAYLDVILDESDRMSTLVGQLLDLSRLEAGAELRREPLDLAALTAEVLARLEPAAQVGAIALVLDLVPVQVEGDRRRLEELLAELGTNALKHCPPGGEVRVVLRLEGNRARLSVENDGPAIPAEDLPHLWEPFYKGDKSRSREGGGSGLGLALVKGAAEAHKGTCRAENRSGGGVRFTIELPALHSRT